MNRAVVCPSPGGRIRALGRRHFSVLGSDQVENILIFHAKSIVMAMKTLIDCAN